MIELFQLDFSVIITILFLRALEIFISKLGCIYTNNDEQQMNQPMFSILTNQSKIYDYFFEISETY